MNPKKRKPGKPPKPHLCTDCGTDEPEEFSGNRKSICTTCYNVQQNVLRSTPRVPTMTPEEKQALIDRPIVLSTPRSLDEALGLI